MPVINSGFKVKQFIFNKTINILLITNALILMAAAMLGPIYALFVEDIGGDLLDASLAAGVYALMAGTTVLLTGKYADKVKDKKQVVALIGGLIVKYHGFSTVFVIMAVLCIFSALYTYSLPKKIL